jgi:HlyD family secretion protein
VYQTQLEQNRLDNEKALALADYNITRLTRSVKRRSSLVGKGAESQEVRDNLEDELDYALKLRAFQARSNQQQEDLRVQQLPQIRGQLDKLHKDVEITRAKLENLTVRAPGAGRMTAIDLKVGENRNRGERFGEITPDTGSRISASIDEYYLRRLHKGQVATVDVGGKEWTLVVSRVYPKVEDGVFTIDLDFDGAVPEGLLPGQALQGRLSLGSDAMALVLPAGPYLAATGGDWVFVVAEDGGSAQRRRIRISRRSALQVEIVSGLNPDERVITSAYTTFDDVERVEFVRSKRQP